jgi:hypothetical protein
VDRRSRILGALASCVLLAGIVAATTLTTGHARSCADAQLATGQGVSVLTSDKPLYVKPGPLTKAEQAAVACYVERVNTGR